MRKDSEIGLTKVIESDYSHLSPFAVRLALVDPWMLGTHEECLADYNFEEIDYSSEYFGPAIAVAGYSGDNVYHSLNGQMARYQIEPYGELGVLDGRHRLEKARMLGLSLVPVQIFPVRDPNLILGTWLKDAEPLTVDEVVSYFKLPELHVPAKVTKFQAQGTDGRVYRLSQIQPKVRIPITALGR